MKKFGLIGYPIAHSKSPDLFRAAYPAQDEMTYDLIEQDYFEDAFDIFLREYEAVNVTAPFKELAFKKVDVADTISRELKAVNILKKQDGKVFGYNSDFWAMNQILESFSQTMGRLKTLVVGCGGAAKAAALAAYKLRWNVSVANRDIVKARKFCFSEGGITPLRLEQAAQYADEYQCIIYALPLRIDLVDRLNFNGRLVVEANYKDPCLAELCRNVSATYVSGIEWLERQAISGFKLMTEKEADASRVIAYCNTIKQCQLHF